MRCLQVATTPSEVLGKFIINSSLWCKYKMGTCGSNKQIIENRANRIMTQRIFNMGKPSAT